MRLDRLFYWTDVLVTTALRFNSELPVKSDPKFRCSMRCSAATLLLLASQAAGAFVINPPAAAPAPEKPKAAADDDLSGLDTGTKSGGTATPGDSTDDLSMFNDIPVVISAARREQKLSASSVPVSILTSQDIRYGGRTSIADALRYVPGMDVVRVDRGRYAVGVRGMHHEFADRTLVLINGRNTGDVSYGGTDWMAMPVLMDDIDRIEIVRGPGGAVWGANAFNGVINILTRKPEDSHGFAMATTLTEFGDSYSQFRWGGGTKDFSWRLSAGYEELETSQDALNNETFTSHDFQRGSKFDGEGVYGINADTRLRFGFAQSHQERGPNEFVGYAPVRDGRYDTERFFARLEHTFSPDMIGHVQWYTNLTAYENPALIRSSLAEHDIEGQLNFKAGDNHQVTVGGNARFTHIDVTGNDPQQVTLVGDPFSEAWAGVFVTDRWQISRSFALEGQVRGDTYSGTGNDWSGRFTSLYSLDADAHHTLRAGVAKAFRAPSVGLRNLSSSYPPPPGYPPFITSLDTTGNQNAHNEQMYSFETGYTGELGDGWILRADAYYQILRNVAGFKTVIAPPAAISYYDNTGSAEAYGAEVELSYFQDRNKAAAYVAWNGFDTEYSEQETRSYYPAQLKFGLQGRAAIGDIWTLNANYAFASTTHRESPDDRIPVIHSVDLSVSCQLCKNTELQLGINDIFDRTGTAVKPLGTFTTHETPGRTLYATLRVQF